MLAWATSKVTSWTAVSRPNRRVSRSVRMTGSLMGDGLVEEHIRGHANAETIAALLQGDLDAEDLLAAFLGRLDVSAGELAFLRDEGHAADEALVREAVRVDGDTLAEFDLAEAGLGHVSADPEARQVEQRRRWCVRGDEVAGAKVDGLNHASLGAVTVSSFIRTLIAATWASAAAACAAALAMSSAR